MNNIISVVMPVLNEEKHIRGTLDCLRAQMVPGHTLEFLLVDGGSSDGTQAIIRGVAANHPAVKLLNNPSRKTPAAFNIGLRAAQGEYVCILGAHASYPPDYVAICLSELLAHAATACSGRLITLAANGSVGARLAAWCLAHRYASSGNSVRTHPGGFVDTVPYPIVRKKALMEAGGYDEQLDRNQDNDMNQRLRARGHRLYLTPLTKAGYYARDGIRTLLAYGFQTGKWNGVTARHDWRAMSARHFAPFTFVAAIGLCGAIAGISAAAGSSTSAPLTAFTILLGSHLTLGTIAGVDVAIRKRTSAALLLPLVILGFHVAYGIGTCVGLIMKLPAAKRRRLLPDMQIEAAPQAR
jgi:glycosyltransferase involved in cell wall biosynthesis